MLLLDICSGYAHLSDFDLLVTRIQEHESLILQLHQQVQALQAGLSHGLGNGSVSSPAVLSATVNNNNRATHSGIRQQGDDAILYGTVAGSGLEGVASMRWIDDGKGDGHAMEQDIGSLTSARNPTLGGGVTSGTKRRRVAIESPDAQTDSRGNNYYMGTGVDSTSHMLDGEREGNAYNNFGIQAPLGLRMPTSSRETEGVAALCEMGMGMDMASGSGKEKENRPFIHHSRPPSAAPSLADHNAALVLEVSEAYWLTGLKLMSTSCRTKPLIALVIWSEKQCPQSAAQTIGQREPQMGQSPTNRLKGAGRERYGWMGLIVCRGWSCSGIFWIFS